MESSRHFSSVFLKPESVSIKRLAWAFGCAKKDSDEERQLYRMLRERFEKLLAERRE